MFADLAARVRYAVRFAADNHVWPRIELNTDPVANHRLLVQDQDSRLCGVLHIGIPRSFEMCIVGVIRLLLIYTIVSHVLPRILVLGL